MDFSVSALNHGHGGCFAYKEVVAAAASGKYDDIRLAPHGRGWGNASTNGATPAMALQPTAAGIGCTLVSRNNSRKISVLSKCHC